jgi:hypothetical protein
MMYVRATNVIYLNFCFVSFNVLVQKTEITAVGIRHADHATRLYQQIWH